MAQHGTSRQMAKLLSQKVAIKLLLRHGWKRRSGGKHVVKMTKSGQRPVTLPMHKGHDYSTGLTARILLQANLTRKDLEQL